MSTFSFKLYNSRNPGLFMDFDSQRQKCGCEVDKCAGMTKAQKLAYIADYFEATGDELDPNEIHDECDGGDYAMVDVATLCRHLQFDPRKTVLVSPDSKYTVELLSVFPWDIAYPYKKVSEDACGSKTDYETEENPFGWVDRVKPVFMIELHCNPCLLHVALWGVPLK